MDGHSANPKRTDLGPESGVPDAVAVICAESRCGHQIDSSAHSGADRLAILLESF